MNQNNKFAEVDISNLKESSSDVAEAIIANTSDSIRLNVTVNSDFRFTDENPTPPVSDELRRILSMARGGKRTE